MILHISRMRRNVNRNVYNAGLALTFFRRYKRSDWRFCACAIYVKSLMCSEKTKRLWYKYGGLFVRMHITSQQKNVSATPEKCERYNATRPSSGGDIDKIDSTICTWSSTSSATVGDGFGLLLDSSHFSYAHTLAKHSFSICAYRCSAGVNILEQNATGFLLPPPWSCMSTPPIP